MTALKLINTDTSITEEKNSCLGEDIRKHVKNFFRDLDGQEISDMYEVFLTEFEKPLFEIVMQQTRGNITKAASLLGLNRGTLRNRLKKYNLT